MEGRLSPSGRIGHVSLIPFLSGQEPAATILRETDTDPALIVDAVRAGKQYT